MNRRRFARDLALAGAGLAAQVSSSRASSFGSTVPLAHGTAAGEVEPFDIAMVVYPEFTSLDLVGPYYAMQFIPHVRMHFVAASRALISSEGGLPVGPTATFENCPRNLTALFVPGSGRGLPGALRDARLLDFLADRGSRAQHIASVCTGSMLLGAAGLLKGYRATSHWLFRDALRSVGAIPVDERLVEDRNRITGAGVTAGIDFGLAFVARLAGASNAKAAQLMGEYDPKPPFRSGTPSEAAPELTKMMRTMHSALVADATDAAARAAALR